MKIGIIETGRPAASLEKKHGNYPKMFASLVGPHLPDAEFFTVSVVAGEILPALTSADGWIITGSRHGAYDDLAWIKSLEGFIRDCTAQLVPLIGVCFGHQIIAQTLGGKVEKSTKGWGVGPHSYHFSDQTGWMAEISDTYFSHAVHQDQIVEKPKGATVIAHSDFCKYAALVYGDTDFPIAISVQSHPEISAEFVKDLGAERLAQFVPSDVLAAGLARLGHPVNNAEWGKVFARYFKRAALQTP